ncbi:MAG: hypothetical protein ACTSO3_01125 [Candidatus Heimdallarchaeaceae archaeon]
MVNLLANNNMAQEVYEIEHHLHNYEDWFGIAVAPDAELHVADDILGTTLANPVLPFQLDGGNEIWGSWVQILGSSDTPNRPGNTHFDLHKIEIVGSEHTNTHYFIQIATGATGAAGLSALTYTTVPYLSPTNQAADRPIIALDRRSLVGEKAWARCVAMAKNEGTINFYFGTHEYSK